MSGPSTHDEGAQHVRDHPHYAGENELGADESNRAAAAGIGENLLGLSPAAPAISAGDVPIAF